MAKNYTVDIYGGIDISANGMEDLSQKIAALQTKLSEMGGTVTIDKVWDLENEDYELDFDEQTGKVTGSRG